jgi:PadR family transcriptional regulator, regulatory protein AphA
MLKYILLGFLNYKAMTGYDLKRLIDLSTGHFWHAYHSQIYTTLRKMEADGLAVSEIEGEDDKLERRLYTLTASGQGELQAWLHQPLTELSTKKDELLVKLFFSAGRERSEVLDELRLQRSLHRQKLAVYEQIDMEENIVQMQQEAQRDMAWEGEFWRRTLENGLAYEMMYLQWLDNTIQWLESH